MASVQSSAARTSSWRRAISASARSLARAARRSSASDTTARTCSACRRRIASTSGRASSRPSANSRTVASIAEAARPARPHEQALVHERGERLEIGREHGLDVREIERPGEDREALEEIALVVAQQCVAPVDRRRERPVPLGRVLRAGAEQVETRAEAREQVLRREQLRARRRELDRERQPVEACTQLSRPRPRPESTLDAEPAGALREQLRRDHPARAARARARPRRPGGAARGSSTRTREVRARAQERRERRRGADHLLEVVEHEQQPLRADVLGRVAGWRRSSPQSPAARARARATPRARRTTRRREKRLPGRRPPGSRAASSPSRRAR